uniref:Putative integral membrane transporter protein n=1 Tax=Streptomyces luridus TaxID=67320 RepID=D7PC24_STRLR|nr:putative integral membrane transporter protein [Streptomyces luridus]
MTAGETAEEIQDPAAEDGGGPDRLLLSALAVGAFAIGTDSLVISGLLNRIASDLSVSPATTGQLISVFALVYAVGAPVLATVTAGFDRRRLLLVALTVFIAANVLGAVAPNYPVLLASRVLAAVGAGLYLPCAMVITVSVTPERWRGRGLAMVAGGMSAATALGVPLGTLIGAVGDWRATLVLVAVLATVAVAVLAKAVPRVAAPAAVTLGQRLRSAAHPQVLIALLANALACAGEFTVMVYVAPLAEDVTGVGAAGVSAFLLVSGLAALAGSAVGGRAADRFGGRRAYNGAVAVLFGGLAALVLLTLADGRGSWVTAGVFALLLCVVSVASWALPPAQNHAIAGLDIPEPTVALSLNGSSSYLGLAMGGVLGGLAMEHGSSTTLTAAGAAVELSALALLLTTAVVTAKRRRATAPGPRPGK